MSEVRDDFATLYITPTITAGAYSANDVVGGLTHLDLKYPTARRSGIGAGAKGILRQITIVETGTQAAALDLYFFKAEPTPIADNAAFTPPADELVTASLVQVASADYSTVGSLRYVHIPDLGVDFIASTGLWLMMVATGTPTFGAVDALDIGFLWWPGPR